jgi:glycosyltransferase involved in cell wall biosynthesis
VISIGAEEASGPVAPVRHWIGFSHQKLLRSSTLAGKLRSKLGRLRPDIHPGLAAYFHQKVSEKVQERMSHEKYDLAVIEELSLAHYQPVVARTGCKVVYDAHNVEIKLRTEIAGGKKGDQPALLRRLHAEEKRIIERADLIWTCSEVDSDNIRKVFPNATKLAVVPNGVDVDGYQKAVANMVDIDWHSHPLTLVYPASFSYKPNVEAALTLIQQLAPALRARGYKPKIVLVGREPHPSMKEAAAKDPDVLVTGAVDSILPYFNDPCIMALPITQGSGTRLKILEAFAWGRPVVSTSKGCEGIEGIDGESLFIRDDIESMADTVVDLWNNNTLRRKVCASALKLVREKYSWDVAALRIKESLGLQPSN